MHHSLVALLPKWLHSTSLLIRVVLYCTVVSLLADQPRSAKVGILRSESVPSTGTMTAFCDGWAAYDALDDATRERIHDLEAFHSGLYSQAKLGQDPAGATPEAPIKGGLYVHKAYLRPLVKRQ